MLSFLAPCLKLLYKINFMKTIKPLFLEKKIYISTYLSPMLFYSFYMLGELRFRCRSLPKNPLFPYSRSLLLTPTSRLIVEVFPIQTISSSTIGTTRLDF